MKIQMDLRAWARVLWLLAAFMVLAVGVGCISWPGSQELSQRHAHALELYDEANAIDAATRRAAQLRAAQARIASDLTALGGVRSAGGVTAALLRLLHDESNRQAVDIREVAPDTTTHGSDSAAAAIRANALLPSDVAISVRGPFRNIVALVADLPRHDVLIDVRDIHLSATESDRVPPVLDVTLHATIYRLAALLPLENSRVRTVR